MKIVRYVVIIIVTIWLSLNEGFTAFESMDRSAEGVKAGGGGTAKLMGVSSLYYNAAGLAGMEKTELNVQYSRLLLALDNDGLDYFHLIAGYPFGGLGLAVSFNRFSSELYAEQILSIGCGGDLVKGWYKTIAGGVRVKLLKVGYEENDYTRLDRLFITEGYSQNALSFDVGLLGYSKAGFSYGI
ncbi:MAG: hypothetical protein KKH98_05585, partial [Spirochaetes bacterium]|nr:hypothetical protein [Spirochaetota bacterium]